MLNAVILAALVKLNLECKSPWVAAGLFATLSFVVNLVFGTPLLVTLIAGAINLGLGFLYFWLLKKTEDSGIWWFIMLLGVIGFLALGLL